MKVLLVFLLLNAFMISLIKSDASDLKDCVVTSDCETYYSCEALKCVHKDVFPMDSVEIIGTVIIAILIGFANTGKYHNLPFNSLS